MRKYKHLILFITGMILLLQNGCGSGQGELNGEVFIVTNGRENIRLGLVPIYIIKEKEMKYHIDKKNLEAQNLIEMIRPDVDKAFNEWKEAALEHKRATEKIPRKDFDTNDAKAYINYNVAFDKALAESEEKQKIMFKKDAELTVLKIKIQSTRSRQFLLEGLDVGKEITKTNADGKFSIKINRNERYAILAQTNRQTLNSKEEYCWLIWASLDGKPTKNIILSNDNLFGTGSPDAVVKIAQ